MVGGQLGSWQFCWEQRRGQPTDRQLHGRAAFKHLLALPPLPHCTEPTLPCPALSLQLLEEYSQAEEEEREEMFGGGSPFAPFQAMLQFALEPLVVPGEQPTSPAEVARLLPAAIKLLRTLKFCEDATTEPRTQVGICCSR